MKILFSVLLITASLFSIAQSQQLVIPRGHNATIKFIATSPDKKWLASGDEKGTVKLWDMITAKEVKTFDDTFERTFLRRTTALTFSPDSKKLFIGHAFNLQIIDLSNKGKEIFNNKIHEHLINQIIFSSKGKIFATAADEEIKIWNLENLESPRIVPIKGYAPKIAFDDANNIVVATTGNYIDENLIPVITNKGYITHINTAIAEVITTAEFENLDNDKIFISPNGKLLATIRYEKLTVNNVGRKVGTVQLLDIASKTIVKKIIGIQDSTINLLSFSGDSHYMVTMAGKSIILYDLVTLEYVKTIYSNDIFSGSIFSNADGSKLFQAISTNGSIVQWNFNEDKEDKIFGGGANFVKDIAITPNQQSIILLSGANEYYSGYFLQKFSLKSELVSVINNRSIISNMQNKFDGGYIASAGGGRLFETDAVNAVDRLLQNQTITAFSVSNNNKMLVTTNRNESSPKLSFYSLSDEKKVRTISLQSPAYSLLFAKDDKILFVGHERNNKIDKIDIETGSILKTFERIDDDYSKSRRINLMMLSKDESILIGINDLNEIYSWNTTKDAQSEKIGYGYSIKAIPNKNEIIFGNSDNNLEVYDLSAKKISRSLKYPFKTNGAMDITADGKFIFYSNNNKSVSIVDFAKGEVLATMVFFGKEDWIIVDKAGRFNGTETGMHNMYYVKGLDVLPLESGYEQFYTPNLLQRILEGENFKPPVVNINTLKDAPTTKISAAEIQRNLSVDDDDAIYNTVKEQVSIKVQADCPNDGVTEIRLFQNGKLVATTRNLVVEDESKSEKSASKTFAVTLLPGANNFKAIAFNTERTESKPAVLIVNYKPAANEHPASSTATLHLIVVGVNSYKNPKYNLNYALADATSFSEAMVSGSKDLFAKTNTIFIKDADATKEGMTAAFEKVKAIAQPQDLFVFYYAGHGVINDKNQFFLVPYDVTQLYGNDGTLDQKGFSAVELQQMSKDIKAQKQLFILDACQSAGALNTIVSARGAAEEKAIAQLARSTGTYWLTASSSEQFASEFAQLGHGSFTYCLLQAFKGDANLGDNKLTVKILDAYLQTKVPEITQKYKGTVQYPVSYSYGNDFPITIIK